MNPKKTRKKTATQISAEAEKRIVDVSLRHPDFGARRLVPLLKKQKIDVSASKVYGILKRQELQTRALRMAKLKKQAKKPKPSPKKSPIKISDATEKRIVKVSLKNPDFGAGRLVPLLKKQKINISESRVYGVLKRHKLQIRALRQAKIKQQARRRAKPKERPGKKPHTPKKATARISDEVIERIGELSLQHPDYGARRLVPFLKKEKIDISPSRIYRILKQKGLQTRLHRLQKLEEQRADQAPSLRELADTVPPEMEERVTEAALQHPDRNAQYLADLLKAEDVPVSEAAVSRLLKSNGLENRDSRLLKLEESYVAQSISLTEDQVALLEAFNPSFRERHVESKYPGNLLCQAVIEVGHLEGFGEIYLHLAVDTFGSVAFGKIANNQKPETAVDLIGNQVLPFYREHDFPILAILTDQESPFTGEELHPYESLLALNEIEHRLSDKETGITNGFLERFKRTVSEEFFTDALKEKTYQELKEVQLDFDIWLDHYNAKRPFFGYPNMGSTPMEIFRAAKPPLPETFPDTAVGTPASPRVKPAPKAPVKSTQRSHWAIYAFNFLLIALIAYLGFNAVRNIQQARLEEESVVPAVSTAVPEAAKTATPTQPLQIYRKIWERNLFNISIAKSPVPEKEISIEKIAVAKKNIGLKLVGTVVSDDPMVSRAIIDNSKTREQEAYREGDQAGKIIIKKILRNKVVITTTKGDELLTIEPEEFGRGRQSFHAQQQADVGAQSTQPEAAITSQSRPKASSFQQQRRRSRTFSLERQEVEESLADPNSLVEEMSISPHLQGDQPAGFKIGKIPRDSVLTKMGLRSGDVIAGVDDQEITGPDQAADFFKRLAQGGETTIKVKKGRGVRRRTRIIQLNIE